MFMILFMLWIFCLPFVFWGQSAEASKIIWLWLGGGGLVLYWLQKKRFERMTMTTSDSWYVLWMIILTLASVFGVHPYESFIGGSFRYQGVLFFLVLWLIGKTIQIIPQSYKTFCQRVVAGTVIVSGLFIFVQYFLGRFFIPYPVVMQGRAIGLLGDPNGSAGYIAIASIYLFFTDVRKHWVRTIVLSIFCFIAIVLTGSRAGLLAGMVTIIGVVSYEIRQHFTTFSIVKIVSLLYVVIFAGLVSYVAFGQISILRPVSPYENRQMIWNFGITAIARRPVLGYGAESEEFVYQKLFLEHGVNLRDLAIDRAHNIFLDIALWSGIVGLVAFCGWIVSATRERPNGKRIETWIGIVSWIAFAFIQPIGAVHWVLLIMLFTL